MNILASAITKLGNKIELLGTSSEDNILIIGVFHGDEPQGKYLIEKYLSFCAYPPLEGGSTSLMSGWGYAAHKFSHDLKLKAKELRNNTTLHEKILWKYLRKSQMLGLKFRRQQPVGNYIADFLSCYPKIIIELDGSQHFQSTKYDIERDNYLESLGYQVIRIWNNDITHNIEGVLNYIKNQIQNPTPKSPKINHCNKKFHNSAISTLPQGEGIRESSILFIPCLNPDGMQLGKRTNANGVDLNRNFPTKNWGEDTSAAGDNPQDYYGGKAPASEIETQFVIDVIEKYKPKLILTLHAPYKIVNYDGPAREIAQNISDIIGYPVEESIGYPTPGSFGTYCGVERNIPTITLELDEKIPVEQLEQQVFEIFNSITIS